MNYPLKATYIQDWPDNPNPGDFTYSKGTKIWNRLDSSGKAIYETENEYLVYCCPCGCGDVGSLELRHTGKEKDHPTWIWDGNIECPTLQPSIRHTVGCKWHGHLTNGEFTLA